MRFGYRLALCAALGICGVSPVNAQKVVHIPVVTTLPQVDGVISAAESGAAVQTSMTLVGGYEKPKHGTDAFMAMTPAGFYVGFRCAEGQPDSIIAKAKTNGAVFMDDSVELFLCPNKESSKTNYFHFAVNASGVPYSNSISIDRPVNGWQHAASKTQQGWEAELLIPLVSVGAIPGLTHWRLNMSRNRPARGDDAIETSAWVDPGTTFHNYRKFGYALLTPAMATPVPVSASATGIPPGGAVPLPGTAATSGTAVIPAPPALLAGANATTATIAVPPAVLAVSTTTQSTRTAAAVALSADLTTHTMVTSGTSALYR